MYPIAFGTWEAANVTHGQRTAAGKQTGAFLTFDTAQTQTVKVKVGVSFVSRENAPGSLAGRIPAAITDGRLEKAAGVALTPETSHVMLCGNPQMLKDASAALIARGLRKHRRRAPGHITVESFW